MSTLKASGLALNLPKLKNVYNDEGDKERRIVVTNVATNDVKEEEVDARIKALLKDDSISLTKYNITHGYLTTPFLTILKHYLPEPLHGNIPTSFETVGTLAHVNLRPEYLPYKYIIGRVITDKNPSLNKVVNKIDTISTQFRTFPMEVISGKDDGNYVTLVKEGGVRFELDFSKVYWNSRLGYEHKRLSDAIVKRDKAAAQSGDGNKDKATVADIMAGIGPFAIPLGSANVTTLANDLNPESYKYLNRNVQINKCKQHVQTYCKDGREFIHDLNNSKTKVTDCIMNLPATAVEFLDAFRGWDTSVSRPLIHVYCFVKCQSMDASDAKVRILPRVVNALGCNLGLDDVEVVVVRDVAPKKPMCCVTFRLPEAVETLEKVDLKDYVEGIRIGSVPWEDPEEEEKEKEGVVEEESAKKRQKVD
jgi:tRNA (guanine37-N1)-methyltransferase